MNKSEYAEYTRSEYWQERRKAAIVRIGHQCENCGLPRWIASLAYDQDLHVHHRNYQNLGKERDEDLEVLCRRCHEMETFGCSDLKPVREAKCSLCGTSHWDVYADYCPDCKLLFSINRDPFFLYLDRKDKSGKRAWRAITDGVEQGYLSGGRILRAITDAMVKRSGIDVLIHIAKALQVLHAQKSSTSTL